MSVKLEINIRIDPDFSPYLDKKWLRYIFRSVLENSNLPLPAEASLLISSSKVIRKLNREYRHKDEVTDVLSFGLGSEDGKADSFPASPDGIFHLGEVVISYPRAREQAAEREHSLEEELAALIIHGALHLLGYDHEKAAQVRKMRAKERRLLEVLFRNPSPV